MREGRCQRDLALTLADGTELPIAQVTVVHRDADGQPEMYSTIARDTSEIREVRDRLEESEAWYRSLVQRASDVVTVSNRQGTVVYASPSVETVLGMAPEDLVGRHGLELVHPDDREMVVEASRRAHAEPGTGVPYVVRVVLPDRGIRIFESVVTWLFDDSVVRGVVTNSRDVTERERSALELQARAAADALVAAQSGALVAATPDDVDARITDALGALAAAVDADAAVLRYQTDGDRSKPRTWLWFEPTVGPAPDALLGAIPQPDRSQEAAPVFLHTIETDAVTRADGDAPPRALGGFSVMASDLAVGSVTLIWRVRAPSIVSEELAAYATLGTVLVSTVSRVEAEAAVHASEERFRSLAEHSSDLVLVYGPEGEVIYLNPPAARFTGFEVGAQVVPSPELHHPDDADRVRAHFASIRGAGPGGSSLPFEVRIRRRDGEYRWLELIGSNLLDDPVVGGIVINARDVTDRHDALESMAALNVSLQRSNETLGAIVGSSPLGIFALDADGAVTLWNPACERMFGWTAAEVVGGTSPLVTPGEEDASEAVRARVMAGEMITFDELVRTTRSGELIDLVFAAAPLRDEQGGITGMLVVVADNRDRIAMQRQVRDNELRFRALVQNVAEGITVIGPDGSVGYSSPAGQRMLGYSDYSEGADPLELVHPEDKAGVAAVLADAFVTPGMHGPISLRVRAADGSWRNLEAFGNNLLDDPAVGGVVVTARDITERLQTEEALRRSDERIAALVENLSDVITIVGPDSELIYSSPTAERLFGFVEGDESWTNPMARVHPDDLDRVVTEFTEHLDAGSSDPVRFRLRIADGSWRDVEAVLRDMSDDPAIGGVVVTTRDVSDRKRAESLVADQARVLRLIAQGAPLSDTLATMCEVVERNVPGGRCSVFLVDEAEGVLRAGAGPRIPPGFAAAIPVVRIAPDQGSCGAAAFHGEAVIVEDVEQDPRWVDFTELALAHGLRACWSTPIIASTGDRVIGTFAVYYEEVRGPTPTEEEVVEMVTALGAIAIERKGSEDRLAHQAHHDPLTGLPNRVLFVEFLTLALARAQRQQSAVAVLFLDLDRFKFINDRLGHDCGDELLVKLSDRLRGVLRPGDTVARFGGDEFTVLCDDLDVDVEAAREQAIEVAQRLLDVIELPTDLEGEPTPISASIGIAIAGPGDQAESMLRDADAAMYLAKERGKGRWEIFDEEMRSSVQVRLDTENALYRALERSELRIYYQPIVSLGDARCTGAEALVRWAHPERGLVAPDDFIDVAEETGLIVPMGAWVLEEACRAVARWHESGGVDAPFSVSVNLSARQLAHSDVVQAVRTALDRTGADPAMLGLEITESVLMGETSVETVAALKALGVKLSIDDFGTGYSSLGYLKRFPVDVVKVDRSFVDGLGTDPEDSAIVAAVVSLGHALGLEVVAEGVETERQLAELVRLGCDFAQGYWFAAAQEEGAFLDRIRQLPSMPRCCRRR
jgi:diguanylate cyclase (GGDEF)-like protein/PAS domain S-box-containing protein